jgi:hypothetical protein
LPLSRIKTETFDRSSQAFASVVQVDPNTIFDELLSLRRSYHGSSKNSAKKARVSPIKK